MDQIEEILTRGVENIIPGKQQLEKLLRSGKKLNIYNGIDPTATHVHMGNAVPLRKLQVFVELGHHVTFLIGDFTALIGDTSDKEGERPVLTSEQITENFRTYKKQAEKVLDFSKVKVVHNSEWLGKLSPKNFIKLFQQFTLNDFISRELIKKRLTSDGSVRLDEVVYPLLQGYDSYELDTDIQVGGTDQTFNMQAGRALQKKFRDKESYVLATSFLEGTDGRKMSKSWGNAIWLDDSPENMFGKVMSVKDDLIIQYFTLATNLSMDQISQISQELKQDKNPMLAKKTLAHQIVKELHSEEAAEQAEQLWDNTYSKKVFPAGQATHVSGATIIEVLLQTNMSASDVKRLVSGGAVDLNGTKVVDRNQQVSPGDEIKAGDKIFIRVK